MTDSVQPEPVPNAIRPFRNLLATLADRLAGMDADAVQAWLDDVLAERVPLPRALPDDTPVPTLVALDPLLDDIPGDHFRRALRTAVDNALRNAPSSQALAWSLQILISLEDRKIGNQLARCVNGPDFSTLPAETKCRILSAIIDLRFHPGGGNDFWEKLRDDPDAAALAGLIFHAVSETDALRAIRLLPDLETDDHTLDQIALAHLPLLWEWAGKDTRENMRQALFAMRRDCPERLARAIDDFAEEADVDLSPPTEAVLPYDPAKLDKLFNKFESSIESRPTPVGFAA